MKKNYWTEFWNDYAKKAKDKDVQSQVLRTLSKKPIELKRWKFTLSVIKDTLDIKPSDVVLDLCCGNGLITKEISKDCKAVTAVDISKELIEQINIRKYKNIITIVKDVRNLDFKKNSFSKIIIYAGLQYLNYKETVTFFESVFKWLKVDGLFFIGDIPDLDRIWFFFNTKEREKAYFESIKKGTPIVGTWFSKNFLLKLANYCGFKKSKIIKQHKNMIYSNFRYDMLIKK